MLFAIAFFGVAAADPALLPDGARRLGARSGPAAGPAGHRGDDHDAARRPPHRPLRPEPLPGDRDPADRDRARSRSPSSPRTTSYVLLCELPLRARPRDGLLDDADDDRGDAGGAAGGDRPHLDRDEHHPPGRAPRSAPRCSRSCSRARSPPTSPAPAAPCRVAKAASTALHNADRGAAGENRRTGARSLRARPSSGRWSLLALAFIPALAMALKGRRDPRPGGAASPAVAIE